MFLQVVRPTTRLVAARARAPLLGTQTARYLSTGDAFKKKESVEEARYMREQEKKFFDAKKAEKAAAVSQQELTVFEEVVAPAMVEVQELLKGSGDSVSHAGMEALAKWKLGMKK